MLNSIIGLLLKEGKSVTDEIKYNIDQRGVKASGKTQAAIRYQVDETNTGFTLTVYGPTHIQVLEDGRGPTKGSGPGKSLTETIRQWIDDKGIQPESGSKDSMAFLIARSIHRQGTLLYRHGGHSGVLSDVINEDRVKKLGEELMRLGLEDLKEELRVAI